MNSINEQDIQDLLESYTGRNPGAPAKVQARQEIVNKILLEGGAPDVLAREVEKRIEQKQRRWQSIVSIVVASFILIVFCLALGVLLTRPGVNNFAREHVLAWLNTPTTAITATVTLTTTPTLTPTVTPTPPPAVTLTLPPTPPPVYHIQGKVVPIGNGEGSVNATINLNIRFSNEPTWQNVTSFTLTEGGIFSFDYTAKQSGIPEAKLVVDLPGPWQLWETENVELWSQAEGMDTFTLVLTETTAPPLNLTAAVVRQFEGQVAFSTMPDGANFSGAAGATVQLQTCPQIQAEEPETCTDTGITTETGGDGYFKLVHPSPSVDALTYQLVPIPPEGYATQPITTTVTDAMGGVWNQGTPGLVSTHPLAAGTFANLNMVLQLQSITILATDERLVLGPDQTAWTESSHLNPDVENDPTTEYFVYTTIVPAEDPPTIGATWQVYLPAGEYYVEVWTPEEMSTPVKYTVELIDGSTGEVDPENGLVSLQVRREGRWFDFQANQSALTIISTGELVTVRAVPTQAFADTTMAVGPIRFVVGVPTTPPATPTATPAPSPTPRPPLEAYPPSSE